MDGEEEECNKYVFDTCKKAERNLPAGGAGKIIVYNRTTNKPVYIREI
jgi:hypothetical protein